jgi:hypothetical protein
MAKKKKSKSNPVDLLLGDKMRAGTLLSSFLRKIAQESTELVADPNQGDRMATKAEALARLMWKMALGYKEEDVKTGKAVIVHPDKGMMSLLFDRIEGRASMSGDLNPNKRTVADRISEQSKDRLNSLTQEGSNADANSDND